MLDCGLALLGERGGAARGRDEVRVAQAARATGRDHDALAVVREIGDLVARLHGGGVELADDGAHGDLQDEVLAVGAVLLGALAMRAGLGAEVVLEAILGAEVVLEAIVDERRELGVGLDDDGAAMAAVAAVGPALGNEGLATERHAARAAVAALDVDAADIGELGHGPSSDVVCANRVGCDLHIRGDAHASAVAENMGLAYQMPVRNERCAIRTRPLLHTKETLWAKGSEGLLKMQMQKG